MNDLILMEAWRGREEGGAKTKGLEWCWGKEEKGKGTDKLKGDGRIAMMKGGRG